MNFCLLSVISTFIRRRRSFPLDRLEKIITSNLIKFKCEIELLCAHSDNCACLRHTVLNVIARGMSYHVSLDRFLLWKQNVTLKYTVDYIEINISEIDCDLMIRIALN
jgi:hypothetical protein